MALAGFARSSSREAAAAAVRTSADYSSLLNVVTSASYGYSLLFSRFHPTKVQHWINEYSIAD